MQDSDKMCGECRWFVDASSCGDGICYGGPPTAGPGGEPIWPLLGDGSTGCRVWEPREHPLVKGSADSRSTGKETE